MSTATISRRLQVGPGSVALTTLLAGLVSPGEPVHARAAYARALDIPPCPY